ncbi:MAG: deoxyribodipyrimidine photo-lyase [Leptolyngbyaceae cyanobacterium CRU_2_3]|nr:deoxyribodipyrimidine photo-lyase [Leptolyngbyaceae cyanobacterium CRU_2_3]
MPALLWFNEDGLNPEHQMVKDYADAPRIYIFDVAYMQQWKIAKHRVQFIYESLLEIPDIQIYQGETMAILQELVEVLKITKVVTTETPNHIIKGWQQQLQCSVNLVAYPEIFPGTDMSSPTRFARYWRKHQQSWLTL